MKYLRYIRLLIIVSCVTVAYGIEKTEYDVFDQFISGQFCYGHPALNSMKNDLCGPYWQAFKKEFQESRHLIIDMQNFLVWLTQGCLKTNGSIIDLQLYGKKQAKFAMLFDLLENDMAGFFNQLRQHQFMSGWISKKEQNTHFQKNIEKYKAFSRLLFAHQDITITNEYLFSFANYLFEFCFNPQTWSFFNHMLCDRKYDPLLRFIYTIIWFHLVGEGWHNWSKDCLKALRERAALGDEIVYIAGGADIYQLLRQGIYSIRIIDPMLPSQKDYYPGGWRWLLGGEGEGGGIGDRVFLGQGVDQVYLERVLYQVNGEFRAQIATGETINLPRSVTQWKVYGVGHVCKGCVTIERRFCQHDDLRPQLHKTLLLSFNEMYYVAMGKELGGWDVDPQKLPATFSVYIKQLRRPVNTKTMALLRASERSNFNFIRLGSVAI